MALPTTFGEDDPTTADPAAQEEPYLFLVLEAARPATGGDVYPLARVKTLRIGRAEQRVQTRSGSELAIGVPDGWMSRQHVCIERVFGQWVYKDLGSSNGTRCNGERAEHGALRDGDVLEIGHSFFVFREALEPLEPGEESRDPLSLRPDLCNEYRKLSRVAESSLPVLLLGESGSGKEVSARAVHGRSGRTGPLIAVNCGAIAPELLESELFGAERGAFTGAEKRLGLVRAADKGTLFLDEIGDMPARVQVALLRVLEQREVTPVGSSRAIPVDFRLISATHRDLRALAAEGRFRADLLARITGFEFTLWSLRERREDLGLLVASLMAGNPAASQLTFAPEVVRALLAYAWPLNVRELYQCLALVSVLAQGGRVELAHLPPELQRASSVSAPATAGLEPGAEAAMSPRDRARRAQLLSLIDKHAGNVSHVARELGKARSQVQRWLGRYGIDALQYRR